MRKSMKSCCLMLCFCSILIQKGFAQTYTITHQENEISFTEEDVYVGGFRQESKKVWYRPNFPDAQIKYYLPQDVKTACLCIYNLQGTQIKQITITQRGEDSQWISGSELTAGMYLYALIADGKEVDTKRMILTK